MTEYIADVEALDLSGYVRPGDTVVWGQACTEPVGLTGRLLAQRAELVPCVLPGHSRQDRKPGRRARLARG